jgi:hypothetical protein
MLISEAHLAELVNSLHHTPTKSLKNPAERSVEVYRTKPQEFSRQLYTGNETRHVAGIGSELVNGKINVRFISFRKSLDVDVAIKS